MRRVYDSNFLRFLRTIAHVHLTSVNVNFKWLKRVTRRGLGCSHKCYFSDSLHEKKCLFRRNGLLVVVEICIEIATAARCLLPRFLWLLILPWSLWLRWSPLWTPYVTVIGYYMVTARVWHNSRSDHLLFFFSISISPPQRQKRSEASKILATCLTPWLMDLDNG